MSGDQPATSFGDPNALPHSPKQIATSPAFPGSVFETPKQNQGSFEDSARWTPRFAEEYSVFNATPGNLRGSEGPFVDFSPVTPYPPSAGSKRPLSAGGIAAEIATHATHFSPDPNVPLPPVDPSRRLQSSPLSVSTPFERSTAAEPPQSPLQERSAKKLRRETLTKDSLSRSDQQAQGQTATPPPSARKGERKLAPKLTPDAMQNDQGYPQPDFTTTPQQPNMADVFATTPTDMFGYPMTAPASAPVFASTRPFWDDGSMVNMDMDFTVANPDVFQTPTPSNRPLSTLDWGNSVFQNAAAIAAPIPAPQAPENVPPQPANKRERPLAPKMMMPPPVDASAPDPNVFTATYPTPIEDPFGIVGSGDGVNPGLLFSQPPPTTVDAMAFDIQNTHPPSSSAPAAPQTTVQTPQAKAATSKAPARGVLRRSASAKEIAPAKLPDRASASSPIKRPARPGLSRSQSENRGKRPLGRPPLSMSLVSKATAQPRNSLVGNRSTQPSSRPTGRISPSKGHHHRLSSLTSIPEVSGPRTRTAVKFTIDAHGRARAEETTVMVEEKAPASLDRRRHSLQPPPRDPPQRWASSDDDSSSTDDDPIIIPSRNASFALPDPLKPTRPHPMRSSRGSFSERGITVQTAFARSGGASADSQDDGESEAETVMNDAPAAGKAAAAAAAAAAGDAASELRKLMETRQKRPVGASSKSSSGSVSRRLSIPWAAGGPGSIPSQHYPGNSTISPTTLTDSSGLATPSTDSRSQSVRCVCSRPEVEGDDFFVQCGSCEMWLHGRCINISEDMMPRLYICAFCADTPTIHGNRGRDEGRKNSGLGLAGSASSPLAHKSFKSFR